MKLPQLRKQRASKNYHGITINDDYSWIDQQNILEVLKDSSKLLPEVRKYLEENNNITEQYFADSKNLQKKLFDEIKSKIKLDDTSLKFKDKRYFYWTKTTAEGNYGKKLRQLIDGSRSEEVIFDGDIEKKKHGSEYFGLGTVDVSYNDKLLSYSLDLVGSEYYTIYIRDIATNKIFDEKIKNTSGSVTWSLDNKSFFYSKLDKFHRARKIYKHILNTSVENDELIYEEKDETFTCGIGITSDEKFFVISTSDHITTENHFFPVDEKEIKPKLFLAREKDIRYSIDSWKDGYFYLHTNKNAEDHKILRCKKDNLFEFEEYIPAKKGTIVGGVNFLDSYIIRGESSDAIPKLYIRNLKTNKEEEIKISNEQVGSPGISLMQRDTNTTKIWISWESMATQGKIYEYDIITKEKKLVKEVEIPSGHDPDKYVVKRLKARSHDGRMIPITLVRRKDILLDGKSKMVLYAYGAYKHSVGVSFGSSRFCLVDRGITFAIAHVRGGGEMGEHWHKEALFERKKNSFLDYIAVANHLIEQKYTYKGEIGRAHV